MEKDEIRKLIEADVLAALGQEDTALGRMARTLSELLDIKSPPPPPPPAARRVLAYPDCVQGLLSDGIPVLGLVSTSSVGSIRLTFDGMGKQTGFEMAPGSVIVLGYADGSETIIANG